jgi:hypothetical protein
MNDMELLTTIFEKAGFGMVSDQFSHGVSLDLFYIANADGSPRWVWPVDSKSPMFLRFYNVNNNRSRLFAACINLVFFLRLTRFVFPKTTLRLATEASPSFSLTKPWALFTGTCGPNRKAVFYADKQFIKVPLGKDAAALLLNESLTLHKLALVAASVKLSFGFPQRFKTETQTVRLSDIKGEGTRCSTFTAAHVTALRDLCFPEIRGRYIK